MAFGLSAGAAALVGAVAAPVISGVINRDTNRAAARASNAAADASAQQAAIAGEQWDRYLNTYAPLEDQMVLDAQNYDSPENFSRAAGDASASVSSQFGKARDRLTRTPGLDPSQAGYQSAMVGLDLAQAASDATQQNAARQKVRDVAYARKNDALSLGKGLPGQASTALSQVASTDMSLARFNYGVGQDTSAAIGNVVNRVLNPPGVKNWLGSATNPVGAANSPGGSRFGMDLGFDD